jgi:hypothetical protein
LERWYAACKKSQLPAQILQPKLRSDRMQTRVVLEVHKKWLTEQAFPKPDTTETCQIRMGLEQA